MSEPLRIVSFNVLPPLLELISGWAEKSGHSLALVVTSPGTRMRRSDGYKQIAAICGEKNIEVLITTRMKSVATPVLAALKPDLIISATFPWLLPPELLKTARIGAINLHPAVLPAYRGPNVMRQVYEQAPEIGCTLHWTAGEFDTGNILAQHSIPLPRPCTLDALRVGWFPTFGAALFEGAARAIAGDPGRPQPTDGVSYAAQFSEAESWLDINEPAAALQCKTTALNFLGGLPARARIGDGAWHITQLDPVDGASSSAAPGTILETTEDGLLVQTGDGLAKLKATRLAA